MTHNTKKKITKNDKNSHLPHRGHLQVFLQLFHNLSSLFGPLWQLFHPRPPQSSVWQKKDQKKNMEQHWRASVWLKDNLTIVGNQTSTGSLGDNTHTHKNHYQQLRALRRTNLFLMEQWERQSLHLLFYFSGLLQSDYKLCRDREERHIV